MVTTHPTTPQQDGFWMPAEFEAHSGCWMLFPERSDTWRNGAKPAQRAFAAVAAAIAAFEPVTVGVSARQYAQARHLLPAAVRVVELSSNDAWMRDMGATFLVDAGGRLRGVDWIFNAWGGVLYFPWDKDAQVAQKMLEMVGADRYKAPIVMEGGAIHVDGQGTLLTTEQCLLRRNPQHSKAELESYFAAYLGVQKVIWLGEGVHNDETTGHVDNLCCFVRPGVVALTWTDDPQDPQFAISQAAYDVLCQATDARGRTLTVHKIHQPAPLFVTAEEAEGIDHSEYAHPRPAGNRLAASYINFYIANGGVVMPAFDDPQDEPARQVVQALFPERRVVSVYSREILLGGGNIHCITQQQPAPHTAR